jgi:hypothetical protein
MKIAIIDSGIHPGHPHVGEVAGGISLTGDGDYLDRLGHGTAVAGAIRERAPDAELYAVKVFDWRLRASIDLILSAVSWCVENQMDLVNLSLGTENPEHRAPFVRASGGALIVGPFGVLPVTVPVTADYDIPREIYRWDGESFVASPFPRSIPGVPPDRNLRGVSFAVANMTGFVARALAQSPPGKLHAALIAGAKNL